MTIPRKDETGVEPSTLQSLERHIFGRLGRGFLVLIPLIVTLLIIGYLLVSLRNIFSPTVDVITSNPILQSVPAITPVVWTLMVVLLLGFFYFVGALVIAGSRRRVVQLQTAILSRIPVAKTIYGVARQASDALATSQKNSFSRVVLLEWPRPGIRAMGFVTGHCHVPDDDRTMLVVYIPTVPNPTSGMLAILPETEVVDANITVEEAMKVVFSGGIVLPAALRFGSSQAHTRPKPEAELGSPPKDESN
ncbi:DUF502 domain-containing protein [Dehalococcoidia bacterium]|nr:DUF502 domain-containing protein [Dehalococcoidia bacterium]